MGIHVDIESLIHRRTKIVATIGPASSDEKSIRKLIEAGANIFRLNMSHGEHQTHTESYQIIRSIADDLSLPIAILADLCGPKIRVGKFPDGPITLEKGDSVILTTRDVPGKSGLIPSQYATLHEEVKPGDRILLADGLIGLHPDRIEGQDVFCTVVHGGQLSDNKGINLPDTALSAPALTEKDKKDARFALALGVDYLALSFVRKREDVLDLRDLMDGETNRAEIIAKIERPEALTCIDEILDVTDGIMVARGDLGVELPPEQVPMIQQQLIGLARAANKPVIVATQMLESMIDHAQATRAEVADVSHAVSSGADGVMLSGETAVGKHPVEAVALMDRIARQAESCLWHGGTYGSFGMERQQSETPYSHADALAEATTQLSQNLLVHAIVVVSDTGASTRAVSSARPSSPVVAITNNLSTYRRMNLLWGVVPILTDNHDIQDFTAMARQQIMKMNLTSPGDHILLVRGFHSDPMESTPSITILCL
ncbi:MAG: pyruvate kinase [Mariprofundaceae bacterium]